MTTRKLLLLAFLSVTLLGYGKDRYTIAQTGQPAPDFVYKKDDSVSANLSDLKGKVVIVNFFAIWCPPCKKELPMLTTEIYNKHKDNPNFEMMIFGRGHTLPEIKKYADPKQIENVLPFYPDKNKKIFEAFAYDIIPRTYIIDKKGMVVHQTLGFNEEDFKRIVVVVDSLLQE